ncbi:MAG: hypothetical protein AAF798_13435 [Bacteroidota bacterium]
MESRRSFNINSNNNPFGLIIGLLVGILIMVGLFRLANFIFQILYYISPILLIATLIIDYKVVVDYGQWIVKMLKRNTIAGVAMILVSVLGFPILSVFLLGKALFKKRLKKATEAWEKQTKGEFVDYEELDSEPLELPKIKEKEPQRKTNKTDTGYENLFDE